MIKKLFFPIRRLHGYLHERKLKNSAKNQFIQHLSAQHPHVYVMGTPFHTNIGDSAIVVAEMQFLHKCGFPNSAIQDLSFAETRSYYHQIKRFLKDHLLIWHGGGNMGDQWLEEEYLRRDVLRTFRQNATIIFPQTIHYGTSQQSEKEKQISIPIYGRRKRTTLVAREESSYKIMNELYSGTQVLLTPDIVLSATMESFGVTPQQRNGILLCMRSDIERSMDDETRERVEMCVKETGEPCQYTDMYSDCPITKENRIECVRKKMNQFASAKAVITDRLHGMIFAAITGTPCIVFSNYNHKVRGTYEWIKYLPYIRYAECGSDVEKYLPELLKMKDCVYDKTPLEPHFEKLAEVVKHYAHH